MVQMIIGSNEYALHIEALRNRGVWPPKDDEKAPPLPQSKRSADVTPLNDCNKFCCLNGGIPMSHLPGIGLPYTHENKKQLSMPWVKVGKNGKPKRQSMEYLINDDDDILD